MQTAVSRIPDSLSGKHFCVLGGGYFLNMIFNSLLLLFSFLFWCPGQIRPTFEEKDMYAVYHLVAEQVHADHIQVFNERFLEQTFK